MYGADYEAVAGELAPGESRGQPRYGTRWRGAGGRWLVWTFRIVVWAILLVIGYRGVMAIVLNETPPASSHPAAAASVAPGFPAQEASAYALQFAQVYLNASPAKASQRASDLVPFLPPGVPDPQLGWNGGGSLSLQSEDVAAVRVQDAQHAIVTLLARVNDKLMQLGVPVYAKAAGIVVSGGPVSGVTRPAGGDVRHIVTTVVWKIPWQPGKATWTGNTAANLEVTYALTIVKQHGTWYVQCIAASTQVGGQL
jgi:hypothetical protein